MIVIKVDKIKISLFSTHILFQAEYLESKLHYLLNTTQWHFK